MACAGVQADLDILVAAVPPAERLGKTGLDMVLNSGADNGLKPEVVAKLVQVIDTIERVCRGRERTAQGFWRPQQGPAPAADGG